MTFETTTPVDAGMNPAQLDEAWDSLEQAAEAHQFGGVVSLILRHGQIVLARKTGWAVREPEDERSPT